MPAGDLRSISLHWTAHDYDAVFPAYHYCISGAREVLVHHTHDLRENMRDVRLDPSLPYAAHTAGRNSWSIGVSIAAMRGAVPADFGAFPLTEPQLDAMCRVAAALAAFYGIDVAAIRTHAEAALDDGYFGAPHRRRAPALGHRAAARRRPNRCCRRKRPRPATGFASASPR